MARPQALSLTVGIDARWSELKRYYQVEKKRQLNLDKMSVIWALSEPRFVSRVLSSWVRSLKTIKLPAA
jgi:hypothetical protein